MSNKIRVLHIIDHLGFGGAQAVVKGIFETQKDNKNIFSYSLRNKNQNLNVDHPNVQICQSSN